MAPVLPVNGSGAEKSFCLAESLNMLWDFLLLGQSQKKLQCMLPLMQINLKWLMPVRHFLSGYQHQKMERCQAVASYCCCTSPRQALRQIGQGQASGGTGGASHASRHRVPPHQLSLSRRMSWHRLHVAQPGQGQAGSTASLLPIY